MAVNYSALDDVIIILRISTYPKNEYAKPDT